MTLLRTDTEPNDRPSDDSPTGDMVRIPGGTFRMGFDQHYPEEAPAHRVTVDGFWIDRTPMTNRQFKEFVKATSRVTTAHPAANSASRWRGDRARDGAQALEVTPNFASAVRFCRLTALKRLSRKAFRPVRRAPWGCENAPTAAIPPQLPQRCRKTRPAAQSRRQAP